MLEPTILNLCLVCAGAIVLMAVVMWEFFIPVDRGFHYRGKWCVRYEDGKYSQPCDKGTAQDYATIFKGKVVSLKEYEKARKQGESEVRKMLDEMKKHF